MAGFSQYQGPSPEWEAFVQKTPLPPIDLTLPPQAIREAVNGLRVKTSEAQLAAEDLHSKATWTDHSILTRDKQNIIARLYKPTHLSTVHSLPIYLFFHGGGHLFGNLDIEDAACARLCSGAGILVIHVNYRHTPEFKHPTPFNDAWDSFEWLARTIKAFGGDPNRVIVGGVSAGAGLAAYVVHRHHNLLKNGAGDSSTPALKVCGQLLCIPFLVHPDNNPYASTDGSSYQQNVDAALLPMPLVRKFTDLLDVKDVTDPVANVGLVDDGEVVGMPKAGFLVAGQDLLRDEGLYYAEKLKKNGTPTKVHVFPGLPHGFRRFGDLPSSKTWDRLLVDCCHWFLTDDSGSSFTVEKT
ncbi:hypothetical protein K402DRAFT_389232 [Aulographum hederae CBS 113979]|uniref:Alpha/beta hydrolase fold-3 domain-containing protein n=1 Tax=Aulographum hederae CBS 113979 TaxID=1176131 RepID=A0A6G1HD86_9PEZI|nr:hypothetical protein K402DRAFT_389232 [Aulographum hederae CBS 113979]